MIWIMCCNISDSSNMNHGQVEKHDTVTNIFKDSNYLNKFRNWFTIITDFYFKTK